MAKLTSLIRNRGALKAKLTSFTKFLNDSKAELVDINSTQEKKQLILYELNIRIDKHEAMWQEYCDVQRNIEELAENFDEQLTEREAFESKYYKLSADANLLYSSHKIDEDAQFEVDGSQRGESGQFTTIDSTNLFKTNIRLPQIQLPEFRGKYENWLEFRDTFQSLVHENNSIGTVEKFHYLRSSLKDSASQVIRSIEFSAANYDIAWELLCERYNNKSVLVHSHVKALFNLPSVNKDSAQDLRSLIDQLLKNLKSLQILELPIDYWDTLIIYIVTGRLDAATAREWEEKKKETVPTLEELKTFLRAKADLLETLELNKTEKQKVIQRFHKTKTFKVTTIKCAVCAEEHAVHQCKTFINNYIPESRFKLAKTLNLCINCLKAGHMTSKCNSRRCMQCNAMHHTLLHRNSEKLQVTQPKSQTTPAVLQSEPSNTNVEGNVSGYTTTELKFHTQQVLLSTAIVNVVTDCGNFIPCRALLDCGAQSNFISADCGRKLNITTTPIRSNVIGINQISSPIKEKCKIQIFSLQTGFRTIIECLLLDNLGDIPTQPFNITSLKIPHQLKLADPTCHVPGPIDIILGAEVFWNLLCNGQHKLGHNSPTLQKTQLGWILTGTIYANSKDLNIQCRFARDCILQNQLEKFWTVEDIGTSKILSIDEQHCEKIFEETTSRNCEGRFIVQIPLSKTPTLLGESQYEAQKRFQSLEKRMASNAELKFAYTEFMREYMELGHMSKLSPSLNKGTKNYLPHHGVINEGSSTTKLRVVFDDSAKTSSGYSFNDIQLVGPTLQDDLLNIIVRFRPHTYVVCADITKMYRQILIEPDQRYLQCIYWRENSTEQLETYELNTVTYGTSSAPYLAVRCLRQLGIESQQMFPEASRIILSDFYVDDLITGGEVVEQVASTVNEVTRILRTGGFLLHKWISNNPNVIKNLISDTDSKTLTFGKSESNKTLGLHWTHDADAIIL